MDIISTINDLFLSSNKDNRNKLMDNIPITIVLNNDVLLCMKYDKRKFYQLELDNYHIIKSICHYITGKNLNLIDVNYNDDELIRFIENNKTIFEFDNVKYWCKLIEMIKSNAVSMDIISIAMKHSATLYQSELHKKVMEFKQTVSKDDWSKILVIVTGPPSPRPGHSAMQYFSRLTGKENELYQPTSREIKTKKNRKLYYVENIYDFDEALDIVAQLLLERQEYDKIVDMKKDILAYDTKEYLDKVCKK